MSQKLSAETLLFSLEIFLDRSFFFLDFLCSLLFPFLSLPLRLLSSYHSCSLDIEETARYLAPYPIEECKIWLSLVNNVSPEQIDKIQPKSGKITCLTEVVVKTKSRRKGNLELIDSRLPHKADPDSILAFTDIPSDFPENATPQEKSEYCMDSSHFLEELIKNVGGGKFELVFPF